MVSGFVCGTCGAGFNGGCERGDHRTSFRIFISEHKKAAGPVLTDRKYRLYDSGDLTSGNADPGFGDRR